MHEGNNPRALDDDRAPSPAPAADPPPAGAGHCFVQAFANDFAKHGREAIKRVQLRGLTAISLPLFRYSISPDGQHAPRRQFGLARPRAARRAAHAS
jgi:hypothetical protein